MDIDTLNCIIVTLAPRKRRAYRELCMKNTHVQAFELIEGSFDSNSWFVLFLCVFDVDMLMNVCFLSYIFFYMLCM
jgi:hypothetical protein